MTNKLQVLQGGQESEERQIGVKDVLFIPSEDQIQYATYLLENGLYRSTKTTAAIAEAAAKLHIDPRTIYGWYADNEDEHGFRNWISTAFRSYHEGMLELFTTKLYKRGMGVCSSPKDEQNALAAALKMVASLTKKPSVKEDDNSDGVFKRLLEKKNIG
jgi:hypothetical protein